MGNLPKYFTDDQKHKKSKRQEKRLAKRLGGRRQPGSGSKPNNKGDVRCPDLLIEAKRTDKKSISITLAYLKKISEEALAYGCVPGISIEIGEPPAFVDRDWVMVPASFLEELLDVYRKGDAEGQGIQCKGGQLRSSSDDPA